MTINKKFRFWDGKKMHYWGFVVLPDGMVRVGDEVNWTKGYLMASIGINDKTGKHIFEMDIVKGSFGYDIIAFEEGGFVTKDALLEIGNGCGGSCWVNKKVVKDTKVVGNVFESPLLLQKLLV